MKYSKTLMRIISAAFAFVFVLSVLPASANAEAEAVTLKLEQYIADDEGNIPDEKIGDLQLSSEDDVDEDGKLKDDVPKAVTNESKRYDFAGFFKLSTDENDTVKKEAVSDVRFNSDDSKWECRKDEDSAWTEIPVPTSEDENLKLIAVYKLHTKDSDEKTHEYGEPEHSVLPSCTAGKDTYTCKYCEHTREETVAANAEHQYELSSDKNKTFDATCTTDGLKTYVCKVCSDSYTEVVPQLGHNTSGTPSHDKDSEPSTHSVQCSNKDCTYKETSECVFKETEKDGFIEYKCNTCGYSYKEAVDPISPTTFKLIYNENGGKNAPEDKTAYEKNNKVALISDAAKLPTHDDVSGSKVVFLGWSKTLNERIFADGDTLPAMITEVEFKDADISVYALWAYDTNKDGIADVKQPEAFKEETKYCITYNANGGISAPEKQYGIVGSDGYALITITKEKAIYDGYTFKGWSTTKGGSVGFTAGQKVKLTKDVTLYAVWEKATNPKTGDDSNAALWMAILATSLTAGCAVYGFFRRKSKVEE